ncbi:MAG: hypothetical protein QOF54_2129 [Solirubrobacteraceae bacterium]|nr:hypothetical protein [Solirubrobacteraceae bacterium]
MAGGRSSKPVKAILATCVASVLVAAGEVTPAGSFALPLTTPTVTTLTVPLTTPTVKAPTVPLTTPTVPVKVPTVKTPTLTTPTVKAPTPTVPLKTPTVTVKAPTVSTKAPTVSVKAPTVSTTTPKVTAKAPSVTVGTGGVTVRSPSVSATAPSLTAPRRSTATGGSTVASRATSAGAGSASGAPVASSGALGAAAAPGSSPGSSGSLGSYSRLPAIEARPGSRAFARIASRERTLKALVARLQGCLSELPEGQRELLELRAGKGSSRPLSPRATAAALHVGVARLARLEAKAVGELRDAARTHACGRLASIVAGVASYLAAAFGEPLGPAGAASGGVEAARYEVPAGLGASRQPGDRGLLGSDFSPVPGGAISLLLLLLIAGLALAALIADASGQGPRHEQWRRRMIGRLSSWR